MSPANLTGMAKRRVAVVTDSTASMPAGLAEAEDITVIPLQLTIGDRSGLEGSPEFSAADLVTELARRRSVVTTSAPTPQAFADGYARAATGGLDVCAVQVSAKLSSTCSAARVAAALASGGRQGGSPDGTTVSVIDSRGVGMGSGFVALAAARAAASGASLAEVRSVAEAARDRIRTLFYVDTLEYLRRGGRIGTASALVGTALAMKPLLEMINGGVVPLEKVRTSSRALARLEEIAVADAGQEPVSIAVHHLAAPSLAEGLAERLQARLPGLREVYISEVGAVVGAHVGPGLLSVVVRHE